MRSTLLVIGTGNFLDLISFAVFSGMSPHCASYAAYLSTPKLIKWIADHSDRAAKIF